MNNIIYFYLVFTTIQMFEAIFKGTPENPDFKKIGVSCNFID